MRNISTLKKLKNLLSLLMIKLKVTDARKAQLTQSSQSPNAVLADIVSCQTLLCTSWRRSNSLATTSCICRDRIIGSPIREELRCEKTGLRQIPSRRLRSCEGRRYNFMTSTSTTPTTSMAAISTGFTTEITIRIPNMTSAICTKSIIARGSSSSTAPMSLEKRLRILPEGFVSKNRIAACSIQLNMRSCSTFEACMHILKNKNPLKVVMTTTIMISPP